MKGVFWFQIWFPFLISLIFSCNPGISNTSPETQSSTEFFTRPPGTHCTISRLGQLPLCQIDQRSSSQGSTSSKHGTCVLHNPLTGQRTVISPVDSDLSERSPSTEAFRPPPESQLSNSLMGSDLPTKCITNLSNMSGITNAITLQSISTMSSSRSHSPSHAKPDKVEVMSRVDTLPAQNTISSSSMVVQQMVPSIQSQQSFSHSHNSILKPSSMNSIPAFQMLAAFQYVIFCFFYHRIFRSG